MEVYLKASSSSSRYFSQINGRSFEMSAKAIREYDGKTILAKYFDKLYRQKDTPSERLTAQLRSLQVTTDTDLESACSSAPWINTQVRLCVDCKQ